MGEQSLMEATNKRSFSTILDSLIDQDGLKTDITISIPRQNLLEICAFLLGTIAAGSLIWFSLRALFQRLATTAP